MSEHESITTLRSITTADAMYASHPGYRSAMIEQAVRGMLSKVYEADALLVKESKPDDQGRLEVTVEIGVASKTLLTTMESRIAERQHEIAALVADEAKRLIDNWGSHYAHTSITKDEARRFIDEALKTVTMSKPEPSP